MEYAIQLTAERNDLTVTVSAELFLGSSVNGVDGIRYRLHYPRGTNGLEFSSFSRGTEWNPSNPITAVPPGGQTFFNFFTNAAIGWPGAQAGPIGTATFTLTSAPTSDLVFTLVRFEETTCTQEGGETDGGLMPISNMTPFLTATIPGSGGGDTPTITSIAAATGGTTITMGASGASVNAVFTIVGTNLTAAALGAPGALTATPTTGTIGGLTAGTIEVSGVTATGATVTVPMTATTPHPGGVVRTGSVALTSNLGGGAGGTVTVNQSAPALPTASLIEAPATQPVVMARSGASTNAIFTVTGANFTGNLTAGHFTATATPAGSNGIGTFAATVTNVNVVNDGSANVTVAMTAALNDGIIPLTGTVSLARHSSLGGTATAATADVSQNAGDPPNITNIANAGGSNVTFENTSGAQTVQFTITGSNLDSLTTANFSAAFAHDTNGDPWTLVSGPTVTEITGTGNTRTVTVSFNLSANDASDAPPRRGTITVTNTFNSQQAVVNITQNGDTLAGTLAVDEHEEQRVPAGTAVVISVPILLPHNASAATTVGVRDLMFVLDLDPALMTGTRFQGVTLAPTGAGLEPGAQITYQRGPVGVIGANQVAVQISLGTAADYEGELLANIRIDKAGLPAAIYPIGIAVQDRWGNNHMDDGVPLVTQGSSPNQIAVDLTAQAGHLEIIELVAFIGDTDGNNRLTSRDVTAIAEFVAGQLGAVGQIANGELNGFVIRNANTGCFMSSSEFVSGAGSDPVAGNPNGNVTLARATLLARYLVGQTIDTPRRDRNSGALIPGQVSGTRMCQYSDGTSNSCPVGSRCHVN
jgi:hypothetical protein